MHATLMHCVDECTRACDDNARAQEHKVRMSARGLGHSHHKAESLMTSVIGMGAHIHYTNGIYESAHACGLTCYIVLTRVNACQRVLTR